MSPRRRRIKAKRLKWKRVRKEVHAALVGREKITLGEYFELHQAATRKHIGPTYSAADLTVVHNPILDDVRWKEEK